MTINYIISDSITKIRNAQMMLQKSIILSNSKYIKNILQVILMEGYIKCLNLIKIAGREYIKIFLKYDKNNKPIINKIQIVSKPGKRVYIKKNEMKNIYDNGIYILSTSNGILSNLSAKKMKIGGEIICKIF